MAIQKDKYCIVEECVFLLKGWQVEELCIHTVLQALVVRIQKEVFEAIGDVVVCQKFQIVLIKLKLKGVLVMNLE